MLKLIVVVSSFALSGLAFAVDDDTKAHHKTPHKPSETKHVGVAKSKSHTPKAPAIVSAPMQPSPVPDVKVQEAVAGEVHTGQMACELGNSVSVTSDPNQPARFIVQMKKNIYHMTPVETTTGAVRLEDAQAGAMWLQLPHKSMLMNSKLGQRMADECQSELQVAVAHRMKLDPQPGLLDAPTLAKK